ncbi:MAG: hypothetical protein ACI8S6_002839 [Myxococcota bacterium]|jgi:hypothetical protein
MSPSSATDLAVLRITVAMLLLGAADVWQGPGLAAALASYPPESLDPPWGSGWMFSLLGVNVAIAHAARAGVLLGAALGLVGLHARLGFALAALCGLYLLALPSLQGTIVHNHHLLWLSLLLATSPCADALTIRTRRGPAITGSAYTIPIRATWLVVGAVFFFPGLWKLLTSGPGWIFSDNLQNQIYWKWAQSWDHPTLRIDRIPGSTQAAAAAVVAFELSFGFLLWWPRARTPAVIAALAFHALTAALMDVRFSTLWPCYVAFFSWERRPITTTKDASWAGGLVAAGLVAVVWVAGGSGVMRAWPVACYPTFAARVPATMPVLVVTVVGEDGVERAVSLEAMVAPEPGSWALIWQLIGIGGPVRPDALEAFWAQASKRPAVEALLGGPGEIRFYRGELSVVPEERGQPAERRVLLHVMAR